MSENNHHSCQAIVFKCIDFRLEKETRRWLQENNLTGNCDIVSLAGSSKELSGNDLSITSLLLNQIRVSHDLHQSKQVILIHHSDCGAYKNDYEFKSPEEEKNFQLADLEKSKKMIKENFPDMLVQKIWAQMNDSTGEKVDFQIID
ncbi:MAG: carbonic anhydrase [Candidatus Paceibacterota bacterium]